MGSVWTVLKLDHFAAISSVLDTGLKNGIVIDEMIDTIYDNSAAALLASKLN